MLDKLFVRENLSCTSKIELPYYSVDSYKKICVYCGLPGTSRMLGDGIEFYPKCPNCNAKPAVARCKRKTVVDSDLSKKNNNK